MKIARTQRTAAYLLLLLGPGIGEGAEPRTVQAAIRPIGDRKIAPEFRLINASGKQVRLSGYRGKVVLLDFWATECGGCKLEIPWFVEIAQTYKGSDVRVVGVSVDTLYENLKNSTEAWARVNPFLRTHHVNYPILMGDDSVTKLYDIQTLPITYLIDKHGRIAAIYAGLIDRNDVQLNIATLLKEFRR